MPLTSEQFKDDDRLQQCLILDSKHVVPGERGPHVGNIQAALIKLGVAVISPSEIASTTYGTTTTQAVLRYKGPPRNIINRSYQQKPDNIVGKMTIAQLDKEMLKFEEKPVSLLISVTPDGSRHEHAKICPRLQAGDHERTPINPQGFGRMINIFGDHETDYLGFKDFSTDVEFTVAESGQVRPLTFNTPGRPGLPDRSASDISMRSIPVTDEDFTKRTKKPNTIDEIKRIAMPGCRITFAGAEVFALKILRLGPLLEKIVIKAPIVVDNQLKGVSTSIAWVVVFLG